MMRMDKLVRQCDMEVMKMAMLKHEETFRQQVHELHRLYRIQRQLMSDLTMAELSSGRRRQPRRSSKQPRRALNLQLPADEYIVSADAADDGNNDNDTAELDLTLAVGGSSRKCNTAIAAADGSSPFASDCSGSTGGGLSSPSSVEYSDGAAMFLHTPPMPPPPCQRAMAFNLGMGDAMKQQQSPWLVQCQYLSLRMT